MREGRILLGFANLDAAQAADEVGVPILAPEFAIGHDLETDPFLTDDDVANRRVLHRAQASGVDLAAFERLTGRENLGRAEQTSDVVGPEERLRKERLRAGGGATHRDAALPPTVGPACCVPNE